MKCYFLIGKDRFKWKPEDGGYEMHVASTAGEWILVLAAIAFTNTFLPDIARMRIHRPQVGCFCVIYSFKIFYGLNKPQVVRYTWPMMTHRCHSSLTKDWEVSNQGRSWGTILVYWPAETENSWKISVRIAGRHCRFKVRLLCSWINLWFLGISAADQDRERMFEGSRTGPC